MRDCTGNQDFLGFIEAITAALILVACKLELCRSLINQLIFFSYSSRDARMPFVRQKSEDNVLLRATEAAEKLIKVCICLLQLNRELPYNSDEDS